MNKFELVSSLGHQMSLAEDGALGGLQWDPMGGVGARGSMYSKAPWPGGCVEPLYGEVQCLMGNGHMGPPPMWIE